MLTADISVEAQESTPGSVLSVYRKFAGARNAYKALADGEIAEVQSSSVAVALWTMTCEDQTVLVAHNFSSSRATVAVPGYRTDKRIALNGTVSVSGSELSLDAYSSVVYLQ